MCRRPSCSDSKLLCINKTVISASLAHTVTFLCLGIMIAAFTTSESASSHSFCKKYYYSSILQKVDFWISVCSVDSSENYLFYYRMIFSRNVKVGKGKTWAALHRLKNIRKYKPQEAQNQIVHCESVLLYGWEAWTMTKAQEKSLDGTYT